MSIEEIKEIEVEKYDETIDKYGKTHTDNRELDFYEGGFIFYRLSPKIKNQEYLFHMVNFIGGNKVFTAEELIKNTGSRDTNYKNLNILIKHNLLRRVRSNHYCFYIATPRFYQFKDNLKEYFSYL